MIILLANTLESGFTGHVRSMRKQKVCDIEGRREKGKKKGRREREEDDDEKRKGVGRGE